MVLAVILAGGKAVAGPQTLCVLVPHFKDEYWLSVAYGLEQEAARQGITPLFFEAGGYRARAAQIAQLKACAARDVDAVLLGAVSSDHPELLAAIDEVSVRVPVFGLVNELHSPALSGQIGVDWRDMGRVLGEHLAARHPVGSGAVEAVLISGPRESGWVAPLEQGLRAGLARSDVVIAGVYGADTGLRQQLSLVERALEEHPNARYLIGSAPAVEAAIGLGQHLSTPPDVTLLSTYISHTIGRGLANGHVDAVAFDNPVEQGRMAVHQAVNAVDTGMGGGPKGPDVRLLTHLDNEAPLSPSSYFPEIN